MFFLSLFEYTKYRCEVNNNHSNDMKNKLTVSKRLVKQGKVLWKTSAETC